MGAASTGSGDCRVARAFVYGDPVRRLLMLFGKLPVPGEAKTRLSPRLGAEGAAELYRAFLDDTVRLARGLHDVELELWVPAAPGAEPYFRRRYPDLALRWQAKGDLGVRLTAAFEAAFRRGAGAAVALGSDHPTLPGAYLESAFERLERQELVLGPSEDGGYYAVGLRRPAWPRAARLFEGIPWSTDQVLSRTRTRAEELELHAAALPAWYDVDEPEHLKRLSSDVVEGSRTAGALERLLELGREES